MMTPESRSDGVISLSAKRKRRSPRVVHFLGALFSLALLMPGIVSMVRAQSAGHWLTGYYATYNYSVMTTSQVDYTKLTHIIYWPVIPNTKTPGTLQTTPYGLSATTFSNGAKDLVSRAHAAGAKALIGIGGANATGAGDGNLGATAGFQISTTSQYQATFVNNIISLMQTYGFDGVDLDWEGIRDADAANFTSFIKSLRAQLSVLSPNALLTMAPETKPNGGRPDLIAPIYYDLNQINIQTYVMSGPYCGWETWYNSPLNNGGATFSSVPTEQLPSITNAIADYTSLGIPESSLGMGIQFDSAVWTGGSGTSTGGVTKPKQSWTYACVNGKDAGAPSWTTLPYRQMITTLAVTSGYTTNFDSVADQSWLGYDPSGTGTTNESKDSFVSYDSPTSIAKKGVDMSPAQSGVGGSLGGVFLFELSGDFAGSSAGQPHPLLVAANGMKLLLPSLIANLTGSASPNAAALKWNADPGSVSYNVYSEAGSGTGAEALLTNVATNQATINNLAPGQYWFVVKGANRFGTGLGTQVSVTIPPVVTPTVTWATPASINYGTPLSATQLNATANVSGTFTYSPAAGAILPVGSNQTLTVTFKPTSIWYSTVVKSVSITVLTAALSTSDSFGNENTGACSNAHSITYTFTAATTLGTSTPVQVLTKGVSGLDFRNAGRGTCAAGAYAKGSSCNVVVTFTPTAPGLRLGAVVLVDVNGNAVSTAYINGVGVGSKIAYDPGTVSSISIPAAITPYGVAVDGGGNVYFADYNYQKVLKVTPAGASSTYVSGLSGQPTALAIDGAGNLYIALTQSIIKVTPAGVQSTVASGLIPAPKGLAVGPAGSLFIANTNGNTVLKVTSAGVQTTVLSGAVNGTNVSGPTGLAVDSSMNLYVADSGNNRVLKVSSSGTPSVLLSSGLNSPFGIALGAGGTIYIADENNNRIVGLSPAGAVTTVLGAGVSRPLAVGLDNSDNLYVSNFSQLLKINRATLPSLSFAATQVGSTSSDSPKEFTVNNVGTLPLTFPRPVTGTDPSITTNFNLASSGTCPVLNSLSLAAGLASGSSCNYEVDFAPTSVGALSGSMVMNVSPQLNVSITQKFALSGTGVSSRVVWSPDYYGQLLDVLAGTGASSKAIKVSLPACNPNSVVVNNNKLYVACSANGANPDKILVYNATTIRTAPAGTLTISPLQTITNTNFNSLIGIAFDSSNDLWIASYGNNTIFSISAATLNTA
ncbi:MAG: glycosyl hydrolase family 18 protein, partial [Syntrophobacteraceae bacterium]|nr:glycosyl hydrolase family 18 protein [Syntrophobacteraceae bacterium]